ncbi:MAG: hypothetical protein OEW11_10295 [Nitrospirota bacterium]|nr:hypothetical protein [Nitrospirota bacterium]
MPGSGNTLGNRAGLPLACVFCLAIALPSLILAITPQDAVSMAEKRKLAAFPPAPVSMAAARAFPAGFEAWFNDHFGLRGPLVQTHSLILMHLLGSSPNPEVAVGRGGWLFFGGGAMESFRGLPAMNPAVVTDFQRILESRRDWLAERGIRYLFVVPPDKQSIYPEYVRDTPVGPTPTDHLLTHMRVHSDVEIVDLRPPLLAKKALFGPLFMKTDTHWNGYGAYLGYRAVVERLAAWYPSLHPLEPEAVGFQRHPSPGGDVADQIHLAAWLTDEVVDIPEATAGECGRRSPVSLTLRAPFVPSQAPFSTHCEGAAPLHVLFLRDSFANAQIPLFARTFADVTYVWLNSAEHPSVEVFSTIRQVVARQPVDLVIDQLVERKFSMLLLGADLEFLASTARRQFAMASPGNMLTTTPTPIQQVMVTRDEDGFSLQPTGPNPVIALELTVPEADRWPVVHLALTSPSDSVLGVGYQIPGTEPGSPAQRGFKVPVSAGRGEAVFEIPSVHSVGRLLIRLGSGEGTFILHSAEVRAGRLDTTVPTPTTRLVAGDGNGG